MTFLRESTNLVPGERWFFFRKSTCSTNLVIISIFEVLKWCNWWGARMSNDLSNSHDVFGSTKQCEIQISTPRMKLSSYDLLSRYVRANCTFTFSLSVKRLLMKASSGWRRLSVSRFSLFTLHISSARHGTLEIASLLLIRVNSLQQKNLVARKVNKPSIIFDSFT